jgi:hypothetical protein
MTGIVPDLSVTHIRLHQGLGSACRPSQSSGMKRRAPSIALGGRLHAASNSQIVSMTAPGLQDGRGALLHECWEVE